MSKNNADLLRKRLRSLREAIPVAVRQQNSTRLCELLKSWFEARRLNQHAESSTTHVRPQENEIVAGFWPLGAEPDLRPLLEHLSANAVTIALPVIVEKNAPLEFHAWHPGDSLKAGAFGVMEPARQTSLQPSVLLVPTLGFDEYGARLGYGGGYYDRTLAALHRTGHTFNTIGVAWDEGRLTEETNYAAQPHDYPLDAIVTPSGWHPVAQKPLSA